MSLLPGWWEALALEAARGTQLASGPFWSGRFLCGQPLFGALELPFSSPSAAFLLPGPSALWLFLQVLVLVAGLSLWMRRALPALAPGAVAATALLLCFSLLLHPESAALLGAWAWLPWAALLSAGAPGLLAAPFCALLLCGLSPWAVLLGLGAGYRGSVSKKEWAKAWGLGALLAAPALLEALRLAPGTRALSHPGWPLGFLGSPLAALQALVALGLMLAASSARIRGKAVLVFGLAAGLLAMAPVLVHAPRAQALGPATYLKQIGRRLCPDGGLPKACEDLDKERWVGGGGGLGPSLAVERWRRAEQDALADPDTLSLADVGWLDPIQGQAGRWSQAISAAQVEAVLPLDSPPPPIGVRLFDRLLRVQGKDLPRPVGSSWTLLSLDREAPGRLGVRLQDQRIRSWVLFSENYDPGWTAVAQDPGGRRATVPVLSAEGGFLAVGLDPDTIQVDLEYRPQALGWGISLAALAFVVFAGLWIKQGFGSLTR